VVLLLGYCSGIALRRSGIFQMTSAGMMPHGNYTIKGERTRDADNMVRVGRDDAPGCKAALMEMTSF
jgi:hypothetical protein